MKKLITLFVILTSILIGCEKENNCEITNPENLNFNGCFNFMVFDSVTVSDIENSYVSIQVEREELNLNSNFQSFLIQNNTHITSTVETFNKQSNDCYCSDAIDPELEKLKTWEIQAGTVEIRIVREKSECDDTYVVDVILKNAVYADTENNGIFIEHKEFRNVLVNYILG